MNETLNIIITSLDFGGAERHLLQVLPGLKKLGWKPRIFALRSDCAMREAFERASIEVVCPKKSCLYPRSLGRFIEVTIALFGLYKLFKKDRTSPVHFYLSQAYVLGMAVALFAGHKGIKIMSRRSLNHYQKNLPFFRSIEQKTHQKVDLCLANSAPVKFDLLKEGVPENKLKIIQNGIDLLPFDKKQNKKKYTEFGVDSDTYVMVKTANLIPYKGHLDLFTALHLVKDQLPKKWVLLCIGKDCGIQTELEAKVKELSLTNHIKFLGLRSDVPKILLNSHLGVLCSHEEGMPNAVMEYMAASLPVVATKAGGTVELVEDGKTGFLAPIKNPEKIAKALVNIIQQNKNNQFGKKGREKIEKDFSLESCINKYDKIYKEFLRK